MLYPTEHMKYALVILVAILYRFLMKMKEVV